MDEPTVQRSPKALRARLNALREARRDRHVSRRKAAAPGRRGLAPHARDSILKKTANRCHVCGGLVISKWHADHVLAYAGGGEHSIENYLAAHALCNNYRWDYDSEEFQWILKIGVWARSRMEKPSGLGDSMLAAFAAYDLQRHGRRRSSREPAA